MRVPNLGSETSTVRLTPFSAEQVNLYTEWMQDMELLYQTATDTCLSKQEVQKLQEEWLESPYKFNFIIWRGNQAIGDIGLYYALDGNYEEGEISMMIALPSARRSGLGSEAFHMMANWASATLGTRRITAKVRSSNQKALLFFESKLGFKKLGCYPQFDEVHFFLEI